MQLPTAFLLSTLSPRRFLIIKIFVWLIDTSRSFRRHESLQNVNSLTQCDAELLACLKKLNEPDLKKEMRQLDHGCMTILNRLVLLLVLSNTCFAQFDSVEVLGTIRDATAAAVINASVTLTSQDTGIAVKSETGAYSGRRCRLCR